MDPYPARCLLINASGDFYPIYIYIYSCTLFVNQVYVGSHSYCLHTLLFVTQVYILYTCRSALGVAHLLARKALMLDLNLECGFEDCPIWLYDVVKLDCLCSS